MKYLKNLYKSDVIFFTVLFAINIILFIKSFTYKFFLDDYFFLNIGRANNINEIIQFFSPGKMYFYRPLTTEFFYFIIHLLDANTYIVHWIIWIVYFIGIYFLYKTLFFITGNKNLSRLFVFLYSLHFTHVFQLYHIATFIEVSLFTCLVVCFYFFLTKRFILSIFIFILALLSKETAVLFPIFLGIYTFITSKKKFSYKTYLTLIPFFVLVLGSLFLYKSSVAQVAQDEITYAPHFSPKLIINNTMWYTFWSLGIPNYLPDYMQSIFLPPIAEFWKVMKNPITKYQLISVLTYLVTFIVSTIFLFWKSKKKERITLLYILCIAGFGFMLFISPTLMIIHKWMVRLTVPLIFILLFQTYVMYKLLEKKYIILGLIVIVMYLNFNIFGVEVHENSSTFRIENQFAHRAETYFQRNRDHITTYYDTIYFEDTTGGKKYWGESKKLEVSFHGKDFLDYYFPDKKMNVVWGFKNPVAPKDAFIIPSSLILD